MKTDSQKIDHHLLINQTIIDMLKHSTFNEFQLETKLNEDAEFIPDIYVKGWLGKDWFIECQNSLYTIKQLYSKLDKYKQYYDKGYWNDERLIIIGKVNLKFAPEDYPFKVKQVKSIDDLKDTIKQYKELKYAKFKETVINKSDSSLKFKG
ncbi:replication-relaxation family protein [Neobacillus cucumis]|nr:replication-relaxation family protein [Neobacillus cucumis]